MKTQGPQVFEVMNGDVIWTSGKRIAAVFYSLRNNIRRESVHPELSGGHSLWSFRLTIRVDGSLTWETAEVNCLAKAVDTFTLRVWNLEEKVMG